MPREDVQEWIAKARESMQALGGLIANVEDTDGVDTIAEENEDGADDEDDEEDDVDDGRQYAFDEGEEGDPEDSVTIEPPEADGTAHHVHQHDAASTVGAGSPAASGREGSAAPSTSAKERRASGRASLPATTAAPVGLIAQMQMSLATTERQRSPKPLGRSGSLRGGSGSKSSRASSIEVDGNGAAQADQGLAGALGPPGTEHAPGGEASAGSADVEVKKEETSDEEGYGVAAPGFFDRAGSQGPPAPNRLIPANQPAPHILMRGVVTPADVETLFGIYFEKMNASCSLLDSVLYTPQRTYWTSPFLFTVSECRRRQTSSVWVLIDNLVCTIASRYYPEKPGLYEELTTYAQLAAGTALISGPKNVETVSAYILLSLYPVPMRKWEEDRTWLYLGLAIRYVAFPRGFLPS